MVRVPEIKRASVVVVDDKPHVADDIARQIRPHCGRVIIATPDDAVDVIRKEAPDLLLADLRMEVPGSLVPNALALARLLGRDAPATVIMSGSVSAEPLLKLRARSITPRGVPIFRTILKGDPTPAVIAELDAALKDFNQIKEEERQNVLVQLPQDIPYGTELAIAQQRSLVHEVRQELKAFIGTMTRGLKILKEHVELETWPSWCEHKVSLKGHLDALSYATTDALIKGNSRDTCDALHTIRTMIAMCDPRRVELPQSLAASKKGRAIRICNYLFRAHTRCSSAVGQAYRVAEKNISVQTTFAELLNILPENARPTNIDSADGTHGAEHNKIQDPEGKLRAFFSRLANILATDPYPDLRVRYQSPSVVLKYGGPLRDAQGWGSWFDVNVMITRGYEDQKPTWAYLETLTAELQAAKLAGCMSVDTQQFLEDLPAAPFSFQIKAGVVDEVALHNEEERLKALSVVDVQPFTTNVDKVAAYTVEICGCRCVIIDDTPFNPRSPLTKEFSLQLVGTTFIFSCDPSSHQRADARLYFYLTQRMSKTPQESLEIARDSIRGKITGHSTCAFNVDSEAELIESGVSDIMAALGYPKMESVYFSPRNMLVRSNLTGGFASAAHVEMSEPDTTVEPLVILDMTTRTWDHEMVYIITLEIFGQKSVIINDCEFNLKSPISENFSFKEIDGVAIFSGCIDGHSLADVRLYQYLREFLQQPKANAYELAKSSIRGKVLDHKTYAIEVSPDNEACTLINDSIGFLLSAFKITEGEYSYFAKRSHLLLDTYCE